MEKSITSEQIKLRYSDQGKGRPLVLLHGYLESLNIWDNFVPELTNDFRVIAIDLPGHGKSTFNDDTASMEDMADAVNIVLETEEIDSAVIIGHSLGGYATLAFVDKYPDKVKGFGFIHSSPFADTDEKKANRMREIGLVESGKKELIINTNIPKAFADDNLEKFPEEVERAKKIGIQTPDKGIQAALRGMMQRADHSELLDNEMPKLFILGKKDNYIPFDKMYPVQKKARNSQVVVFEHSGHMGFIEEKDRAVKILKEFIESMR
ncbi:MAG: alpha/beta fold hydrolase [Bacteroidota bacterium]